MSAIGAIDESFDYISSRGIIAETDLVYFLDRFAPQLHGLLCAQTESAIQQNANNKPFFLYSYRSNNFGINFSLRGNPHADGKQLEYSFSATSDEGFPWIVLNKSLVDPSKSIHGSVFSTEPQGAFPSDGEGIIKKTGDLLLFRRYPFQARVRLSTIYLTNHPDSKELNSWQKTWIEHRLFNRQQQYFPMHARTYIKIIHDYWSFVRDYVN